MKTIALLSDTHGYLDDSILRHCQNADEIWHAGDFGSIALSDRLHALRPLRGVYGNIDGTSIRQAHPKIQFFRCEEMLVFMVHIGGYPGHYEKDIKKELLSHTPDLFITGHSHILKIMRDKNLHNMLHINPGAAGKQGFQKTRTMITFCVEGKSINNLSVIELGPC